MSWAASAWAKKTRGHRSHSTKLLLLVLADYHNTETDTAWPSQQTLAADCEMPLRTVQWCLRSLRELGFIQVVQKGNQYRPTVYKMRFDQVYSLTSEAAGIAPAACAPAPAISGDATIAGAQVNPQGATSEPASPRHSNPQEPPGKDIYISEPGKLSAVWDLALEDLEARVTRPFFETYLRGSVVLSDGPDAFVVGVHSVVPGNGLKARVEEVLSELTGRSLRVKFKEVQNESR